MGHKATASGEADFLAMTLRHDSSIWYTISFSVTELEIARLGDADEDLKSSRKKMVTRVEPPVRSGRQATGMTRSQRHVSVQVVRAEFPITMT
jgi:hypothetical protein